MKALYSRAYLDQIAFKDMLVPFERYLYKLDYQRKEIAKLKFHEKDFLFRAMHAFYEASGEKRYDTFKVPELKEQLFYWIILLHSNMIMVFDGFVPGPDCKPLTPKEKRRNKRFFFEYLPVWKNQIEKGEGTYLSIIKSAIHRKLSDWKSLAEEGSISLDTLKQKELYIYGCFFNIYYHVKLFFDEFPKPYILQTINGIDVVCNVYSYVHIYSRHYIPNMNQELKDATMNPEIEVVNLDELPYSIFNLLDQYNRWRPISTTTEYCLYTYDGVKYILWLKYKILNETKNYGFEIRSFYRCTKDADLFKFKNNNWLVLR